MSLKINSSRLLRRSLTLELTDLVKYLADNLKIEAKHNTFLENTIEIKLLIGNTVISETSFDGSSIVDTHEKLKGCDF